MGIINNQLIVSALLAHLIGDFVAQTNKISELKSKNVKGTLIHCIVIFASNLLLLSFGIQSIPVIISLTIIHFGIDCIKLKVKNLKFQFFYFFVDQAFHFASIYLICGQFDFYSNLITESVIKYFRIIIFIIIVTYVSTVIIKQLYFSFGYLSFADSSFFTPKERELDMIFNLIFSVNMLLFYDYWYIVNIALCFIYILIHTKLIQYNNKLLYGKLIFFIIFSVVCYILLLSSGATVMASI